MSRQKGTGNDEELGLGIASLRWFLRLLRCFGTDNKIGQESRESA